MRVREILRTLVVYYLAMTPASAISSEEWPKMRPFSVTTGLNFGSERALLDVPFYDQNDVIQYRLICRGVKESYLDTLMDSIQINYVGPWMCILNEGDRETEFSLLTSERGFAPWHGRGQFFHDALIGYCGSYPEYGRVRHFRLRGFELTLTFIEPEVQDNRVNYAEFKVSVQPDPTAITKYAEKPEVLDPTRPERGCEEVWRRKEGK